MPASVRLPLLAALILLSGCGAGTGRLYCPPITTFPAGLQAQAAAELDAAPPKPALRQLLAAMRYRAPRRVPPVPLLLLSGAADGLVHPACSAAVARAWRLPMAVHPDAGHDLPR